MRSCYRQQLIARLGHADIEDTLRPVATCQDELQRQGCFPGAGRTFDQMKTTARKPATEYLVKTLQSGGGFLAARQGSRSRAPIAGRPAMRRFPLGMPGASWRKQRTPGFCFTPPPFPAAWEGRACQIKKGRRFAGRATT